MMSNKLPNHGLYAITPDNLEAEELYLKVEQALTGGIAILQYRDKTSAEKEKLSRAKVLQKLCLQNAVPLIINDDPHLALACKAQGVHLGQNDGSIETARGLLGENAIIGATCHHDVSLALNAQQQGADYVAFGRFFRSSTKPGKPLATPAILANARKSIRIPIVAIGGITLDNAQPIINAGAGFIAVVEGVFSSKNYLETCKKFSALF
ncbi:MAG: thiamine phosphate synthase [Cycloclasticus sp. symbiont of Poecilosclerida sp. M]|nr:MAG: thiamine phosphate synthase [Cycloclasticus sp. symbiont of Poecilosclerida sp. M]